MLLVFVEVDKIPLLCKLKTAAQTLTLRGVLICIWLFNQCCISYDSCTPSLRSKAEILLDSKLGLRDLPVRFLINAVYPTIVLQDLRD